MIRELRRENAGFIQAGNGKPLAAVVCQCSHCLNRTVTVGVRLDDRYGVRIDAGRSLAEDAVVAAQCRT
jgi:hypothetical protein